MSQTNRKYKRLEALLSEAKPMQPDPGTAPANQDVDKLKAQVAELEGKLAEHQSEQAEIKPVVNQENQTPPALSKASRSLKLSRKILIPVLVMFSLVFLGFSVFSYITSIADARAKEAEDSRLAEEFFQSKIQNITDFANGLAIQTATNPDIQAAFAARDRETLQNLTSGTFQALEAQYQVRQFQFHLSPATSFLRLHSSKFGDDLSTFRFTVVEVNATQHPIAGLEVGRGGAGIRGVQPVFYKGRHIGSVEFGLNFDETLVTSLKEEFGNDWRILLTRDALSLATLEDLSLLKDGPTPDTLVLASTIEADYPDVSIYAKVLNGERLITSVNSGNRNYSVTSLPLRDYSGKIIGVVEILIDRTAIIQGQNNRIAMIVLGMIVALMVGAYILTTITNRSLQPLGELTLAAESIEKGNLNQKVQISGHDEIGQLGHAFNQMSSQLRNLFGSLEQRVLDRTHDLELASEVGRTITEKIADSNEMLTAAAEMIRSRFDLYYTQVYLLDPTGRRLTLRAGTGEVGEQLLNRNHHLSVDSSSLNGRSVLEKEPIIVADTLQSANFKPNPLLPGTRSEMAVPLIAGNQVIGVLDMQSEQPNALNETNLPAFEALAGQLAVALQNASLFAQAEEARAEVEAQIRHMTNQGWQDFMNAIDRGQRMGYAYDQTNISPLKETTLTPIPSENAVNIPINVTGAKVGMIQVANETDHDWSTDDKELLQATANQLAQHIENLRLLAQAEGYRAEAEEAVRRLTREGWDTYLQTHKEETTGFAYNLNEVYPLNDNGNGHQDSSAMIQPLTVRDEIIGEFLINHEGNSQEEAGQILSAVTAQLSAHIENLRLSISNMSLLKSTEDRAQREQILRQITNALRSSTNPATIMRTAVQELGSILGRKTVVQMATPNPADRAESIVNSGNGSDSSVDQPR